MATQTDGYTMSAMKYNIMVTYDGQLYIDDNDDETIGNLEY